MKSNIIRVIGGLGNQMFQYALFYSLKKKSIDISDSLKLDISGFEQYNLHNGLELSSVFNISLTPYVAVTEEISLLKDTGSFFKLRRIIGRILYSNPNKFLKDTHFVEYNFSGFDANVFSINKSYLDGYWQNEKYFKEYREDILRLFRWSNISVKNRELTETITNQDSVSVHIRRFDKVKSPKDLLYRIRLSLLWRVCSSDYYLASIRYIEEHVDKPHFYIFTDNLEWVSRNLKMSDRNCTIVNWNRGLESNQDMYLMSKCRHNIVSMSSFSWWGAWLNRNPNKIIIAPQKWAVRFAKKVDIIPSSWLKK